MRLAIAGPPRSGKTTLAEGFDDVATVYSTDSLIELGWHEASATAAEWFDVPGSIIVEGMATPRALRKWLKANPTGKPVDAVVWIRTPKVESTRGQIAMGKGARTVLDEITEELLDRGVVMQERP